MSLNPFAASGSIGGSYAGSPFLGEVTVLFKSKTSVML